MKEMDCRSLCRFWTTAVCTLGKINETSASDIAAFVQKGNGLQVLITSLDDCSEYV